GCVPKESKYRFLLSFDQFRYPTPTLASSFHFPVSVSNNITFWESMAVAAMYRPSGDQREESSPADPGRAASLWVPRSRTKILVVAPECSLWFEPVKARELPSADQLGSPCH